MMKFLLIGIFSASLLYAQENSRMTNIINYVTNVTLVTNIVIKSPSVLQKYFYREKQFFTQLKENNKNIRNAVFRSIVWPGWGQYYNGSYTKTAIFSSLFLTTLSAGIICYIKSESYYDKYAGITGIETDYKNKLRDNWDKYIENHAYSISFFVCASIVYLYNVTDAYIDAKKPRFKPFVETSFNTLELKFRF